MNVETTTKNAGARDTRSRPSERRQLTNCTGWDPKAPHRLLPMMYLPAARSSHALGGTLGNEKAADGGQPGRGWPVDGAMVDERLTIAAASVAKPMAECRAALACAACAGGPPRSAGI
jgi:hypothetical protein